MEKRNIAEMLDWLYSRIDRPIEEITFSAEEKELALKTLDAAIYGIDPEYLEDLNKNTQD